MRNKTKTNSYWKGLYGEYLAIFYLRCKGYRILAWRYKTAVGEIDIVARRGRSLIFVEVKTRIRLEDALTCFSRRMESRITRAAQSFISRNPAYAGMDMRFDFIAVAPFFHITHLDNAWRPPA